MQKTLLKAITAALFLAAAPPALAENRPGGIVTVPNVIVEGDRAFVVGQGFTNPGGCSNPSIMILADSPALRDRYLAIVMTAMTANLKIDVWVQGCGPTNWGTAGVIYYMNLHR